MFVFAYGVGAYVIFVLTFLYAIGFVENWGVAFTIDGAPAQDWGSFGAWLENAVLLGFLAAQHSLMARPGFQRAWLQFLPAVLQRSTYVLVTSVLTMLLFLLWNPIPHTIWDFGFNTFSFTLEMLSFAGWALAVVGTFQIDHLRLFGLRQVICHVRRERLPPTRFQTPFLYRWVRHPIYLGCLFAFWCTPRMTAGHLLFSALATWYVFFAVSLEERGLAQLHREYRDYQARVPRLLPFRRPLPLRKRA